MLRPTRANVVVMVGLGAIAAYFVVLLRVLDSWGYAKAVVLVLVPVLLAAGSIGIRWVTRHDAAPLTTIMTLGLITKLAASFVRYTITMAVYGTGDAIRYHNRGMQIANDFWGGRMSLVELLTLRRETLFMEDITGILYTVIGPSRLGGFVMFSFLGFWGLVLFHRAARLAVPGLDEHRYALLIYFMPTMVFWPSSIGKEAVMLPALGLVSYGIARLLTHRRGALVPIAIGTWVIYMLRPHVAVVVFAALAAGLLVRRSERRGRLSLGPAVQLVVIVAAVVGTSFMLGQAIDRYLPVRNETVSLGTGDLLDRAEAGTESGGSQIGRQSPNSPLEYPQAVFSVLLRPTVFEANSLGEMLAAAETTAVLVLAVASWPRLRRLPVLMFRVPYLMFCVVYIGIFALAWSSFANLGALVRQRVQVWPYVLVLLAVPAVRPREQFTPESWRLPDRTEPALPVGGGDG